MTAQGNALGFNRPPAFQALQGRNRTVGHRLIARFEPLDGGGFSGAAANVESGPQASCCALSGRDLGRSRLPRAMPWAVMSLPRWGEFQRAQHQNLRLRLVESRRPSQARSASEGTQARTRCASNRTRVVSEPRETTQNSTRYFCVSCRRVLAMEVSRACHLASTWTFRMAFDCLLMTSAS
jgi:hypothetical protein